MIPVPAGLRVLIATKPVDFRRGADGLAALVRETLGEKAKAGAIPVHDLDEVGTARFIMHPFVRVRAVV